MSNNYQVNIISYSKLSIRWKIILPVIIVILISFILIHLWSYSVVPIKGQEYIDRNIRNSTESFHELVDLLISESVRNYLKGRAEDSFYSIQAINAAASRGTISIQRAQNSARVGMANRKIGNTGYFFIINSTGEILMHPNEELVGSNLPEYDFILNSMETKSGYFIYEWQSQVGKNEKKAVYLEYFKPWDWIIVASISGKEFGELIDIKNISTYFLGPDDLPVTGYKYIVDRNGKFIVHPQLRGKNIYDYIDDPEFLKIFSRENVKKYSGIVEYTRQDAKTGKEELIRSYYKWIGEPDWVIISNYMLKEQLRSIYSILNMMFFSNIILYSLAMLMLFKLMKRITNPISKLSIRLLGEEEIINSADFNPGTRDEIKIAEKALAIYIQRLEEEKSRTEEIQRKNNLLARFPNEALFPIIRIGEFGDILYANKTARQSLFPDLNIDSEEIRHSFFEEIYNDFSTEEQIEKTIMGNTFLIFRTPVPDSYEVYLHFHDLTTEQRFLTLQKIWDNVFQTSVEGISITDENANIERINNSFTRITGYNKEDVLGENMTILKSYKHNKDFYNAMWKSLNEKGSWEGEIWNKRKSGELFPEWLSISSYQDSRTRKKKFLAIFHDTSDLHQKEEELAFISSHDLLTNLPNRNLFNDRLKQAIFSAKRTGQYCAVLSLDIDGFSMVNDHLGQIWGDNFLQQMADLLGRTIRNEDTLARLGSDDFAILLPRLERKEQTMDVLQRIWDLLKDPIILNDIRIEPKLNAGISICPDDAETAETLLQCANLAMINSKTKKAGGHQFYNKSLENDLKGRFEMELALKQAVKNQEFRLAYQPKGDLNTDEIYGFEALLRWNHPEKTNISPEEFIPIMEKTGMLIQAGEWIIREACGFINRFQEKTGKKIQVGINISNTQFNDPEFLTKLEKIMKEENIEPESIDLEITESITAMGTGQTIKVLEQLHEMNFSISIDDFGTGYSSLQYLNELPFDVIKIDKSFISPLPADTKRLAIVRSIIGLGKNYGKNTIAEGIETEEQAKLLRDEGCDFIQGYYLSKPLFEEDACDFMNRRKKL